MLGLGVSSVVMDWGLQSKQAERQHQVVGVVHQELGCLQSSSMLFAGRFHSLINRVLTHMCGICLWQLLSPGTGPIENPFSA